MRGLHLAIGLTSLLFIATCFAATKSLPDLGNGASLHGLRVLPDDSPWNQDISKSPVDPNSAALIASIGANKPLHPDFGTTWKGHPNGIPYVVVDSKQPNVKVTFTDYGDESDPGPYPIPHDAPIEGGPDADGDRHVIVFNRDTQKLYEMWKAFPDEGANWKAACGAVWDLKTGAPRKQGWTSADAAGLPIFPGLVRYDEVIEQMEIRHALRFTIQRSRHAYVAPATHYAAKSNDPKLPPMGMRVRLKAIVDISKYPPSTKVILKCLQTYGMIVADNGGDWFLSGSPNEKWNEDELHALSKVHGKDFEVVKMGQLVTR
ncbi:hypothetical protein BH10PLA1_BH10PLA1_05610 [soil metagenome]